MWAFACDSVLHGADQPSDALANSLQAIQTLNHAMIRQWFRRLGFSLRCPFGGCSCCCCAARAAVVHRQVSCGSRWAAPAPSRSRRKVARQQSHNLRRARRTTANAARKPPVADAPSWITLQFVDEFIKHDLHRQVRTRRHPKRKGCVVVWRPPFGVRVQQASILQQLAPCFGRGAHGRGDAGPGVFRDTCCSPRLHHLRIIVNVNPRRTGARGGHERGGRCPGVGRCTASLALARSARLFLAIDVVLVRVISNSCADAL